MKRRNFFRLLAGSLALFGCAPRKEEPRVFGQTTRTAKLQHRAFLTDDLDVDELRKLSPDELMVKVAEQINPMFENYIEDCRSARALPESATIQWVNIPHQQSNPDGKLGYFRLVGQRWKQEVGPRTNDAQDSFVIHQRV